jgi:hypothetical protein
MVSLRSGWFAGSAFRRAISESSSAAAIPRVPDQQTSLQIRGGDKPVYAQTPLNEKIPQARFLKSLAGYA